MSYPSDEAIAARMLDLTSGPTPEERERRLLDKHFGPLLLPIRPLFAWEKGKPAGEGQAGDYLKHLRSRREAGTLPSYVPQTTEELSHMPDPSITITVSAPDISTLMQAVLDLAEYEDVSVQLYRRPEIVRGDDEAPRAPMARVHIDRDKSIPTAIQTYLHNVCQRNEQSTEGHQDVNVWIDYEAEGTGERTRRQISPLRIEERQMTHFPYKRRSYLVAMDVAKMAPRTFLVDNIFVVDGPAL